MKSAILLGLFAMSASAFASFPTNYPTNFQPRHPHKPFPYPVSVNPVTHRVHQRDVCFPQNRLDMLDDVGGKSNITEQMFNQIVDSIVAYYAPLAKAHGATLTGEKRWTDGTVNAFADRDGNNWAVHMFGGLARRPEVTPDGFALVVCHELGHQFGGYAFYGDTDWAAAEGEADYFATQACAKNIFHNTASFNPRFANIASPVAKAACDGTYADPRDRDVCYRTADASQSLANLLAVLGGSPTPKFETPDPSKVSETNPAHPEAQCRLDTYFQGALCTNHFDQNVIPGYNPNGGETSPAAEAATRQATCLQVDNFKVGTRPLCWFKPLL